MTEWPGREGMHEEGGEKPLKFAQNGKEAPWQDRESRARREPSILPEKAGPCHLSFDTKHPVEEKKKEKEKKKKSPYILLTPPA